MKVIVHYCLCKMGYLLMILKVLNLYYLLYLIFYEKVRAPIKIIAIVPALTTDGESPVNIIKNTNTIIVNILDFLLLILLFSNMNVVPIIK